MPTSSLRVADYAPSHFAPPDLVPRQLLLLLVSFFSAPGLELLFRTACFFLDPL